MMMKQRTNWVLGAMLLVSMSAAAGEIKPGSVSDQLTSLTDIMMTCAAIVGTALPNNAAEDGYDILPVLPGTQGDKPVRRYMIQQTISHAMSIRDGNWKYLDHKGSGGNDYSQARLMPYVIKDTDPEAPGQLYDLTNDPGETTNLYNKHPERVKAMKAKLEQFKTSGRSAALS